MIKQTKGFFLACTCLLMSCTLGACGVTHEYKQPDVAFPAGYRGAVPAGTASGTDSAMALLPYRSFFADPTLRALIDTAVVNNIDLLVGLKNIDIARSTLNAAKLGNLPALNVSVQNTRTNPSDNGVQTTRQDYVASATASWEADIWGKIRSRSKSALASYLKTQEATKAVRTRLVADVASGYYNLLMLDAQLDISRKNLALADTTLKMIGFQYNAGQANSLAVQQQEASRQSIALSIPLLEQKITLQENALSTLCGRMPGTINRDKSFFSVKVADDLPSGIPSALLQNRPDVRAAEMAVRAAHADMGEARANLYPTFTVTAAGGFDAFKATNWFTTPGSLYSFLQAGVLQPVFQRGQLKAKYDQSRIKRDQSELEFKRSVLKAVEEVSNALVQLEKIKTQEGIAEERVATLQKAVVNAGMLFQSGMATYLEVIVAQTNALQAELTLADIRRQHLSVMAELYRSLGGGWR
jgi:NodT family efflux transporter outer membrane factor (OMF) lipoprotein